MFLPSARPGIYIRGIIFAKYDDLCRRGRINLIASIAAAKNVNYVNLYFIRRTDRFVAVY